MRGDAGVRAVYQVQSFFFVYGKTTFTNTTEISIDEGQQRDEV